MTACTHKYIYIDKRGQTSTGTQSWAAISPHYNTYSKQYVQVKISECIVCVCLSGCGRKRRAVSLVVVAMLFVGGIYLGLISTWKLI